MKIYKLVKQLLENIDVTGEDLLNDPNTSGNDIAKLFAGYHRSGEAIPYLQFAKHPNTRDYILDNLVDTSNDPDVLKSVFSHNNTNSETIRKLAQLADLTQTKSTLEQHVINDLQNHMYDSDHAPGSIYLRIANKTKDQNLLNKIRKSTDPRIVSFAYENPNMPKEHVKSFLHAMKDPAYYGIASKLSETPPHKIDDIIDYMNGEDQSRFIMSNLGSQSIIKNLTKHPNLQPRHVFKLKSMIDPTEERTLAQDTATNKGILHSLRNNIDNHSSLMYNDSTPGDTLHHIANTVIQNGYNPDVEPNITKYKLDSIFNHPNVQQKTRSMIYSHAKNLFKDQDDQ